MIYNADLEKFRREIDEQDRILLDALARRSSLIRDLAQVKKEMGWPIQDPARERTMIKDRVAYGGALGLDGNFVVLLFELILCHSKSLQRRLSLDLAISRGEDSSVTLGTLEISRYFAVDDRWVYPAVRDLVQALMESRVDYGIVPLFGEDGRVVPELMEELIAQPLSIVGETSIASMEAAAADRQDSRSRFLVLAREPLPHGPGQRWVTAFLVKSPEGAEGFAQGLEEFKQNGIEPEGFHPIPSAGQSNSLFLLFVPGAGFQMPLRQALDDLRRRAELVKVLGSYPLLEDDGFAVPPPPEPLASVEGVLV